MAMMTAEMFRHASRWSIVWGVLLIIFGVVAIGEPFVAALAINVFLAWLLVLAGVVHLVIAFHAHSAGNIVWKLLVGLAYLAFGIYLVMHPLLGIAVLALVLASLFLIEGIVDIILFVEMRRHLAGASWVLLDAIVTLILALLIYIHWPSNAAWVIGTLVGISMIVSGITRVMLSRTVRRALA
jgi:uncharacterized membrane protein HdeD (DUF308 family)